MKAKKKFKKISAKELSKKLDAHEDVSDYFDFDSATKVVNLELPVWAIQELDKEATRRGVARQALIRMWLIDRLDALREKKIS